MKQHTRTYRVRTARPVTRQRIYIQAHGYRDALRILRNCGNGKVLG